MGYRWAYDPSTYVIYFNDFTTYIAGDWTLTKAEAGAGAHAVAVGNLSGGVLVSTNDAADDDNAFFQLAKENFKYVAGKRLHFKMRAKISDATQSDFVAGLQITDTSPLAVTDGIYFLKADGATALQFVVMKDSVATTVASVLTMANDTWYVLEFLYDGGDHIKVLVDGTPVARVALTNVPNDEELAISFGLQNGEAVAKTLSVDYVMVAQERS